MAFFSNDKQVRKDAFRELGRALNEFTPGAIQANAAQFLGFYQGIQQFADLQQRLAGTAGAQAAQAAVRRALGPGSAVGASAGAGFKLGANFGANLQLRQLAASEALQNALGLAQQRAGIRGMMAEAVLKTPGRSGFEKLGVLDKVGGIVGKRLAAFGQGNFVTTFTQGQTTDQP